MRPAKFRDSRHVERLQLLRSRSSVYPAAVIPTSTGCVSKFVEKEFNLET